MRPRLRPRPRLRTAAALVTVLGAGLLVAGAALADPVTGGGTASDAGLASGARLAAGQSIAGTDGRLVLTMGPDGALVYDVDGHRTWSSSTRVAGSHAVMQQDGNLVIYSPAGPPVWVSQTQHHPGAYLRFGADGNLAVVDPNIADPLTRTLWQTDAGHDVLASGARLYPGERLIRGREQLILHGDGNLVLYGPARAIWSTGTQGHPGAHLTVHADGNLVLYAADGTVLWVSRTAAPGAALVDRGDGTLGLVARDGLLHWQVPTGGAGVRVLDAAAAQRGVPYCFAGGTPSGPSAGRDPACARQQIAGYDCSGLALYAVARALGIVLPHFSGDQFRRAVEYGGVRVAGQALRPGDLVFFTGSAGSPAVPGHVGIYAGDHRMIDAQQSGVPVGVHRLYSGYIGAVRYWH